MHTNGEEIAKVSVHGGHSGTYCFHAQDDLEEIVKEYIRQGFRWFGITEHMPPVSDQWIYSFERKFGWDAEKMKDRFFIYADEVRYLQKKYEQYIDIYFAFETEAYEGSFDAIAYWIDVLKPDYIVGSVHHMGGVEMDTNPSTYMQCADYYGGIDELYIAYFQRQYELLSELEPKVVGHFDLVRIFDPEYRARIIRPNIWDSVERNLELIRDRGLILDFNLRALTKGQQEPYVCEPILERAIELGISLVPGDDSHGIGLVGNHWDKGISILKEKGADLHWKKPI